jgi:hypothetical protein
MKFTSKSVTQGVEVLGNDHYVATEYDCTALTSLATDGVIKAGTVIPANNATAKGVLLYDVTLDKNPNGAIVVHGFIKKSKMPVAPDEAAITALTGVTFID